MYQRDWLRAGEAAYEVLALRTSAPNIHGLVLSAIRMHARATGDFARARAALEPIAYVSWDAAGHPSLTAYLAVRDGPIALADLLIQDGQEERGRRLLAEIIGRMNREVAVADRSTGTTDGIPSRSRSMAISRLPWRCWSGPSPPESEERVTLEAEPAFEALHGTPRYETLRRTSECARSRAAPRARSHARRRAGARSHRRAVRTVGGMAWDRKPVAFQKIGGGGQGRNRTTDTRIFSPGPNFETVTASTG